MAAVELRAGSVFDPVGFAAFLGEQPDLGTKWQPRFVRVTAALPQTATNKVAKPALRADAWRTDDPVWWQPQPGDPYRRLTAEDVAALADELAQHGGAPGRLS
jgi:fatty-acyl-CoA synthase